MPIETILAIWGAALSTGLASVKIWEIRQSRPKISTSYSMSAPGHGGNEIIIENASSTPVMVSYWELELNKRRLLRNTVVNGRYPNEGYCNITIGGHSRHVLKFDDQDWFEWGPAKLAGGAWYLKLHIVGRRLPMVFKVYPK